MTERVVDASALAFALTGRSPAAAELRAKLRTAECHAPHLVDAELGNVLRRLVREGAVTEAQARTGLLAAKDVIDYRYAHIGGLAALAWSLHANLTFYDALYVALAARLDVPLVTGDQRLSRAPNLPCRVEVV